MLPCRLPEQMTSLARRLVLESLPPKLSLEWPTMLSWPQEADLIIPLLQEGVEKISTQLEAVQRISLPKMDVALHVAKELSKMREDGTKLMSRQMDAAKQDEMLVDVVKETQELSSQQSEAAKRCP